MPAVSVIMPIYNAERYLVESLESVLCQTLEDIEVICVDDGSTDSTPAILETYAKSDPRIRVISKENAGYGAAMNTGLAAATGDYVGVVEPDDYVDWLMFERLYHEALEHDADIVKGDFYTFFDGASLGEATYCEIAPAKCYYGKVFDPSRGHAPWFVSMMTWEGVYRRSFLEEHGIRHNETPGASFQDNGFWFQAFAKARRVLFVNEALYYYRTNHEGSSNKSSAAALKIADEYAFCRAKVESDSPWWKSFRHVFSYFYFVNLMARLPFVATEERASFARIIAEEWSAYQETGDVDRTLFAPFFAEQIDELAKDPAAYDPAEHRALAAESWAEVEQRHFREETISNSVLPLSIIGNWEACLA